LMSKLQHFAEEILWWTQNFETSMHICNTLPTTSYKLKEPKLPTIDATIKGWRVFCSKSSQIPSLACKIYLKYLPLLWEPPRITSTTGPVIQPCPTEPNSQTTILYSISPGARH
jgi:hypothetical protein